MNKIKFILPLTGLAAVPAMVMTITSCSKPASVTLEGEQLLQYKSYDEKYSDTSIRIQDAMPKYIEHFSNVNEALAKDIAFNTLESFGETSEKITKVEVLNCSFDTKEWQLSCHVKVTIETSDGNATYETKISKLRYSVNPYAEPDGMKKGVYFSPIGVAGVILQDKDWTIEYKKPKADKFEIINHETSLKDWKLYWEKLQYFMCFVPYYYQSTAIEE